MLKWTEEFIIRKIINIMTLNRLRIILFLASIMIIIFAFISIYIAYNYWDSILTRINSESSNVNSVTNFNLREFENLKLGNLNN